MKHPKRILPIIVLSQCCCTSLWFAGNAVMGDLAGNFNLGPGALGHLTTAVQVGFVAGTLFFALLTISDRFAPSKVFFASALAGALCNLAITREGNIYASVATLCFLTGFFLAGIYPVGMKIAADYYERGLGKSLGFLVGALVIGTAFPHVLKGLPGALPWKLVLIATSGLAVSGGLLMLAFVPNGPYRKPGQKPDLTAFWKVFGDRHFRSAAFGYFGHMWELYAFWAFVPVILATYVSLHPSAGLNVPILSFLVIGIGGPACMAAGYLSQRWGVKNTAFAALLLSGICCVVSPLAFSTDSAFVFSGFLLFWGAVVVADSPMFSTLVAQNAPAAFKGTALTIATCVGFAITILSIQLLNALKGAVDPRYIYATLVVGPVLGLAGLGRRGR